MTKECPEGLRAQNFALTLDQAGIPIDEIWVPYYRHHSFFWDSRILSEAGKDKESGEDLFGHQTDYNNPLNAPELFSTKVADDYVRRILRELKRSRYTGAPELIQQINLLRDRVLTVTGSLTETDFGPPWYYSVGMLFDGWKEHAHVDFKHVENEGIYGSGGIESLWGVQEYMRRHLNGRDKWETIKMAEIAVSPSRNPEQVRLRQKLMRQLIDFEHLDEFAAVKDQLDKELKKTQGGLLRRRYDHNRFEDEGQPILMDYKLSRDEVVSSIGMSAEDWEFTRRLNQLDEDSDEYMEALHEHYQTWRYRGYFGDEYVVEETPITILPELERGIIAMQSARKTLRRYTKILRTVGHPLLDIEADELDKLSLKGRYLCSRQNILSRPSPKRHKKDLWSFVENQVKAVETFFTEKLNPRLERMGALLELARFIRTSSFGEIKFDEGQPEHYREGWNIGRPKESQVTNDSAGDASLTVLSGANTSGKSFFLQSDLMMRLAAQSTGFAPVVGGNVRFHKGFMFIGRSGTDTQQNLSAFTKEINDWKRIISDLKPGMRVYIDEGFSTTSSDEQAQLLLAVSEYLRRQGGSVILATHNRRVIDHMNSNDMAGVYHLHVEVDKETGEIKRFFKLEPGADDSYALPVAQMLQMPAEVIRLAHEYIDGTAQLGETRELEFPAPTSLEEPEREALKKHTRSLEHLFPVVPDNPRLVLFSNDNNFEPHAFFTHFAVDARKLGIDEETLRESKKLAAQMILYAPGISSSELGERQKLVEELMIDTRYARLCKHAQKLWQADLHWRMIWAADKKEGVNRAINPFKIRPEDREEVIKYRLDSTHIDYSDIDKAVAFLEIQEILLTERFTHTELLDLFRQAQTTIAGLEKGEKLSEEKIQEYNNLIIQLYSINDELPRVGFEDIDIPRITSQLKILDRSDNDEPVSSDKKKNDNKGKLGSIDMFLLSLKGLSYALLKSPTYVKNASQLIKLLKTTNSVYLQQSASAFADYYEALSHGREIYLRRDIRQREQKTDSFKAFSSLSMLGMKDHDKKFYEQFGFLPDKIGLFGKELQYIQALCVFSAVADTHNFSPIEITSEDSLDLQEMMPFFVEDKTGIANDVQLGGDHEKVQILSGPHASGKTVYEKATVAAILTGLTTGYAPAASARIPLYDRVVYLDRVTTRHESDKSSFATEVDYWNQLLAMVQKRENIFVSIDEAFSTTNPKDQAALTYGVLSTLFRAGHHVLTSTHNHDVIEMIVGSGNGEVKPYHFCKIENGQVLLDHKRREGHESSYAIAIARENGFPEEILDIAEELALQIHR